MTFLFLLGGLLIYVYNIQIDPGTNKEIHPV